MKIASITQTKNNLSAYLDLVRGGETVLIMDRNRPIARLEPVHLDSADADGRLTRLERSGMIRRAKKAAVVKDFISRKARPASSGMSLLDALLAEREEAR